MYQPQPMPKIAKGRGVISLNSPMSWVQVTIGAIVGRQILSAALVLPNIDMNAIETDRRLTGEGGGAR